MTNEIPEAVRIALANLRPGDVVVATYDRGRFRAEEARALLQPLIERGAQVLVVPEGIDLSVLRLPAEGAGPAVVKFGEAGKLGAQS